MRGKKRIVVIVTNFMHEEDLEGGEREDHEGNNEGRSKTCSTPLCKYVTKLEGMRWGRTTKFKCSHGCHEGKP
jgi:hypothetical protein